MKSKSYYDFDRNYPMLKYFKHDEFDSPDKPGSGELMCPIFLSKLDEARAKYNKPMKINSGYRTPEYNKKVGGVKNSSHTNIPCNAADISCRNSSDRFRMILALMSVGFTRFGIGETFIHVDLDDTKNGGNKVPAVMWDYY